MKLGYIVYVTEPPVAGENVTAVWNCENIVAVRPGKYVPSSQLSRALQFAGVYWVPEMLPQRADSSMMAWLIVLASFWYMAAALVGERTPLKSR